MDNIKHEELGHDKSSGSPGGDPTTDSQLGGCGEPKSTSPKTEGDAHQSRTRGRTVNNAANPNANTSALIKDTGMGVEVDSTVSAAATPTPSNVPTTTAKRKRKSKAAQAAEEVAAATEANAAEQVQPMSKIPSLERDGSRSRLPSVVEEQMQQQQVSAQQTHHSEASVKDLENAMSKHLPSPNAGNAVHPNTDFSADALLKQQQQQQVDNEKSSTIQWIGGSPYQQPASMPATALLRQLYANRESVIRATARQTPTGVFYGDQSGPLPTPPGSESSYDNQYLQLHSHPQKTSADAFTNLVSTYGGYHSSIDYHNAMTPPSSVSPRDSNNAINASKAASTHTGNSYEYADPLRAQYAPNDVNIPPLPLKPQPYSAATAAMHHAHTTTEGGVTYSNLDQPQYFAPHSSFHLYHKGTPTSGWYSAPS